MSTTAPAITIKTALQLLDDVRTKGDRPTALHLTEGQWASLRDELIATSTSIATYGLSADAALSVLDDDRRGTFAGVPVYVRPEFQVLVEGESHVR